MLDGIPVRADEYIDIHAVRREAQRLGWTDGQLAAVSLRLPAGQSTDEALREQLDAELRAVTANRVGVAARRRRGETCTLVLLSRRAVNLEPTPSRVTPGAEITLRGTLLSGGANTTPPSDRAASAELAVSFPGGHVRQEALALRHGRFEKRLAVGDAAGVLDVQILISRGRGPRIAAMFPVSVGQRPPGPRSPARVPDIPLLPGGGGETEAEEELAALVLGVRQARGLALPLPSQSLAEVARAHAADMRERGFFAHVTPEGDDVAQRLGRRRVRCLWALENIATAASVQDVFAQWMASPAHRANVLAPQTTALGVGVSLRRGHHGAPVYAVLVLAELADEGEPTELVRHAHARIDAHRRRRHLPALRTDPVLERIARHHSRAMAQQGELVYETEDFGSPVQTVLRDSEATGAAADIFLADTTAIVERSTHLLGEFQRAGVGIYRKGAGPGPQLWITVLYAKD
jgi:uncharacterized protein YkwD